MRLLALVVLLVAVFVALRLAKGGSTISNRRCPKCGQQVPAIGTYCPICGERVV
jgi:predicted amidophosphoribosyltransferase